MDKRTNVVVDNTTFYFCSKINENSQETRFKFLFQKFTAKLKLNFESCVLSL